MSDDRDQILPAGDGTAAVPGARVSVTDVSLVATFAAVIAVGSLVAVPVGGAPVPVTLQTFAVLLAGAVLGARRGLLAVLLYLAVGLAGLPVFAQGFGGPAVLGRPTLGYLLAFPLAAWVVGAAAERSARSTWGVRAGMLVAGGVLASLVVYALGVPVLAARTAMTLGEALAFNSLFIPFDAVKLGLAVLVATSVHRAFPDLLPRR